MTAAGVLVFAVFALSAWLTRRLMVPGSWLYMLDHPNERSLHENPTPRGGGIGITLASAAGALAAALWVGLPLDFAWVAASALLVGGVSLLDDRSHVGPAYRMAAHVGAACLLLFGGLGMDALLLPGWYLPVPPWAGAVFSLLLVVWMVNLYNFMDGMDGFAGGMAVIGFGTFGVLGWMQGDPGFSLLSLVIASAAAGFLICNFPPARIFMGDVGSSVLGLLAAALALHADRTGLFPLWVGLLVFSPFVVDATYTLLRRAVRGERVWEAHRSHCYQRLVQAGWGHRRTVTREYVLMACCAASAAAALRVTPGVQWAILGAWAVAYPLLIAAVHQIEARARPMESR